MSIVLDQRSVFWKIFSDVVLICLGAFLESFAIRFLLVPNQVIDGGLVGVALVLAHVTSNKLFGLFLCVVTLPFLILGYKVIGRIFILKTALALFVLVSSSAVFATFPEDLICKHLGDVELIISGAIVLGVGVGLTLKYGGCVDGTEVIALILQRNRGISVGSTILFFNFFIYLFAAIVFGQLSTGVKSIITYMIAGYIVDLVSSGIKDLKMVICITGHSDKIIYKLNKDIRIGSSIVQSTSSRSGREKDIIMIVASKFNLLGIKEAILEIDDNAFIIISDVNEVQNGLVKPLGASKSSSYSLTS
ncbi:MAG: YitT family protein [Chlamydiia bacterium]|nr:YitT family protein [Chlamydiia bacterium]